VPSVGEEREIIEKKVVLAKFLFHQHEFRIQQRCLSPSAPKWNPLHKLSLPALRFVTKRAQSDPEIKLNGKNNTKAHEHQYER